MSTAAISGFARRPATITAAVVLLAVIAALGVVGGLVGEGENGASFLVIALVMSAVRAVAAFGVWRLRRWAAILGFVITVLDILMTIPFFFDGSSTTAMQVLAAIAVPLDVATLVTLAWPASRRAYI
jgi:hypothetical protein